MTYHHKVHIDFIRESNRIENIRRDPTEAEIEEFYRFMAQDEITVEEMERFVKVYQPNARLRDKNGLNVQIGDHLPPIGRPQIRRDLEWILQDAQNPKNNRATLSPYQAHCRYEILHPFTDGNGRSGRMLWMWMMKDAPLGFLHHFYYQALSEARIYL